MILAVESVQQIETFWDKIAPTLAVYGVRVGGALLLLVVSWVGSGWFAAWMRQALERKHVEVTLARFLSKIVRWLLLAASLLTCLSLFGVNITSFAAVLASGGLAAGLALQGSLSNIVAGAALSIIRPFRIGDIVNIAGQLGKVDDIGLFATRLNTPDNRHIIIPNNQIFGTIIENQTRNPVRRVDVDVATDRGADLDATRRVLGDAVRSAAGIIGDPAPEVELMKLGPTSADWQVRGWAKTGDYSAVRQAIIRAAKLALDREGFVVSPPRMVVQMAPEAREGALAGAAR
ncbi:MAG TPA: mechanosensitive ion channel family protein [Phycisphaerales bacterium]|nr:mechanosensitive ion channel family protein [Phycisphaerales bacterium]